MTNTLELVLILLASAVLVVAVFRLLHLPPLIGYLIVGVSIGPHALGWIPESENGRHLAEFGVVFLMFSIGLEFSLARLSQMRRAVLGLGGLQVLSTMVCEVAGTVALGLGWKVGVVLGGALAMSSTAIVARMLADRMQLETPHGRDVIGMLLFQDLAVVPLLVVVPALGGDEAGIARSLLIAGAKAAVILLVLLFVGQRIMRPWFHLVARRRSQELFFLNVLLVTLGLAYLTERAGLSLALGAFVAGMLIAETEYRHQVEDDIKPFREVLMGLFFVTVGMQLDSSMVAANLGLVLFLSVVPVIFKFALIAALSYGFGAAPGTALKNGLALAQAGEFGLVIMALAGGTGLLEPEFAQIVTAAMLISMLAAPFLLHYSDRLVLRWASSEWMTRALDLHRIAIQGLNTQGHLIICGYGRTGQRLAHLVRRAGIETIALDPDPERVAEAQSAGETVVFGDGTRREILAAAGIRRAAALVVTFSDTRASLRILKLARDLNPAIPVVIRTLDDASMDTLQAAGATEVVPETLESSLMLASHALVLLGVPVRRVVRQIGEVRRSHYKLLRGFFEGDTDWDDSFEGTGDLRLRSVAVGTNSFAVNRTLSDLNVESTGARISLIQRRENRIESPPPDTVVEEGDVIVVLGSGRQIDAAQRWLSKGPDA